MRFILPSFVLSLCAVPVIAYLFGLVWIAVEVVLIALFMYYIGWLDQSFEIKERDNEIRSLKAKEESLRINIENFISQLK